MNEIPHVLGNVCNNSLLQDFKANVEREVEPATHTLATDRTITFSNSLRAIMIFILGSLCVFLAIGLSHPMSYLMIPELLKNNLFNQVDSLKSIPGSGIRSNGTHNFNDTAILISIDGFRYAMNVATLWMMHTQSLICS